MIFSRTAVVRRIYEEGLLESDPAGFLELVHPEIEYVNPPESIDPGTRSGTVEVTRALTNLQEAFDESRHDVGELFEGETTVVADVIFRARARGSESEISQREAHTWTFEGEKIIRFEWGRNLEKALLEARLST